MTDTLHPDGAQAPREAAAGYETSDASLRGVLLFAGSLAAVILVVILALWGMFAYLQEREDRETRSRFPLSAAERGELPQTAFGSPATGEFPPPPRLERLDIKTSPYESSRTRRPGEAAEKNDKEDERLSSSGTDPDGRARLSIQDAMRLVVEESKHEPAPAHVAGGVAGTGGGSNSGRNLPEAKR